MNLKLQVILILTNVLGLSVIINLIRKDVLNLRYSFIWIAVGILSILLAIFPEILVDASSFMGIIAPVNALFLAGFYFAFAIIFSLTTIAARNAQRVKVLDQELAILKHKVEQLEKGKN